MGFRVEAFEGLRFPEAFSLCFRHACSHACMHAIARAHTHTHTPWLIASPGRSRVLRVAMRPPAPLPISNTVTSAPCSNTHTHTHTHTHTTHTHTLRFPASLAGEATAQKTRGRRHVRASKRRRNYRFLELAGERAAGHSRTDDAHAQRLCSRRGHAGG